MSMDTKAQFLWTSVRSEHRQHNRCSDRGNLRPHFCGEGGCAPLTWGSWVVGEAEPATLLWESLPEAHPAACFSRAACDL